MVAYLTTMPAGFPGSLNRWEHATVEGQPISVTTPPLTYGTMVVMDAATGSIRQATTSDTTGFYGLLVRPYPTQGFGSPVGSLNDQLGTLTAPPTSGACDVMRRGYMLVKLGGASAAVKNAAANIWTGATAGNQVQGNVTAVAPGAGTCVALPGLVFMSSGVTGDVVEVSLAVG